MNFQLQAKSRRFRGLVLTGAPGRAIGAVARSQILTQVQALPNAQEVMQKYDEAVAVYVAGKAVKPDALIPQGIRMLLLNLETPMNLPFARELWIYDPAVFIGKVDEPILAIIGKKDSQVDWQIDGQALEKSMDKKTNVTFVYPENSNHVLKHEKTHREQLTPQAALGYNASETELDQEAVDTIVEWLKQQTNSILTTK